MYPQRMQDLRKPAVLVHLNYLAAISFVAAYYLTGHCFCGNEIKSTPLAQELSGYSYNSFASEGEMTVPHQCKSFPWLYQQSYS